MLLFDLVLAIIAIIVGILAGFYVHQYLINKKLDSAHQNVSDILNSAKDQAETTKKEAILEAREKSNDYRSKIERELKQRRSEVQRQEDRLLKQEESLDRKDASFEKRDNWFSKREKQLNSRIKQIDQKQHEAELLIQKRQAEVEKVSSLSKEDARDLILSETKSQLNGERAKMIKESYDEASKDAANNAKNLIVQAIQQCSADIVSETTVTVVNLPNDDMKGRIIGREGRNIRTFETLTGIDLVIDDTPEAVILSGFDPIRREVAKLALEKLIKDGRIHPARIEEMVNKSKKEIDQIIQETGENTIFDLGIHTMNPEMIKLVGRLKFKMYRGQNALSRSIEVAKLSGVLAAELGEDATLAKRAGLLHEIGIAVDQDADYSHIKAGADVAKKYHESPVVINSINAYHDGHKPKYIISELVSVAEKISVSRPGAQSKSLESFVHRLEDLEAISNSFTEVKKSYAIQAGREIRVIVDPNKISDTQAIVLARNIKRKIESDMEYPGHIKITIIRETRSVKYAK